MSAHEKDDTKDHQEGQVSEVTNLQGDPDPISPEDATAAYPTSESGKPDEGATGPDGIPDHGRNYPENQGRTPEERDGHND